MTIRKSEETGHLIAQCDQCFDVVDFEDFDGSDPEEWSSVRWQIEQDGWRTRKEGGKWINICCDCL